MNPGTMVPAGWSSTSTARFMTMVTIMKVTKTRQEAGVPEYRAPMIMGYKIENSKVSGPVLANEWLIMIDI